jgi:hypothetical protein
MRFLPQWQGLAAQGRPFLTGCIAVTESRTPSTNPTALVAGAPGDLAQRLSYAGLIPFIGGALVIWLLSGRADLADPMVFAVRGMTSFAALIVAFLGGVPWGLSVMRQEDALTQRALWTGLAYALGAWIGVCMPPHAGLAWLGALLMACYLMDRKLYPALGAAGWLQLRFRLSVGASLSCFLAAAQI